MSLSFLPIDQDIVLKITEYLGGAKNLCSFVWTCNTYYNLFLRRLAIVLTNTKVLPEEFLYHFFLVGRDYTRLQILIDNNRRIFKTHTLINAARLCILQGHYELSDWFLDRGPSVVEFPLFIHLMRSVANSVNISYGTRLFERYSVEYDHFRILQTLGNGHSCGVSPRDALLRYLDDWEVTYVNLKRPRSPESEWFGEDELFIAVEAEIDHEQELIQSFHADQKPYEDPDGYVDFDLYLSE